jgi:hypothetical protein
MSLFWITTKYWRYQYIRKRGDRVEEGRRGARSNKIWKFWNSSRFDCCRIMPGFEPGLYSFIYE